MPLFLLKYFPVSRLLVDQVLFGAIGFLIYGPQMLIGMHAVEISHKKAAGTATGIIGWIAYLGAACAGYPLGLMIENAGWDGFLVVLMASTAIAILFLLPLWGIRKHPKQVAEEPVPAPIQDLEAGVGD